MSDARVPVTLITGFLGAGKTTLLNALLKDASSGRVAVVVNEFGEAGLDHDLIEGVEDDVVLVPSGCLCCSVRGELANTMAGLLERRDTGELAFERIAIETTGIADPRPIVQTLVADPYLSPRIRVDGLVTVADAVNGPATLDAQVEARSQAAMADLVVLSKTDLVAPEKAAAFEAELKALNPAARIVHSVRGDGIAQHVWDLSGLRQGASADEVLAWATGEPPVPDLLTDLSAPKTSGPAPLSPRHGTIGSTSVILDDPIPGRLFDNWLDSLIALQGPDLLRVKGIVCIEGLETPFVFHGVQHIFEHPVPLQDWPDGDRRSRIVVIGRNITDPELQRNLDMLRRLVEEHHADKSGVSSSEGLPA